MDSWSFLTFKQIIDLLKPPKFSLGVGFLCLSPTHDRSVLSQDLHPLFFTFFCEQELLQRGIGLPWMMGDRQRHKAASAYQNVRCFHGRSSTSGIGSAGRGMVALVAFPSTFYKVLCEFWHNEQTNWFHRSSLTSGQEPLLLLVDPGRPCNIFFKILLDGIQLYKTCKV
jgi:hypothetical protein